MLPGKNFPKKFSLDNFIISIISILLKILDFEVDLRDLKRDVRSKGFGPFNMNLTKKINQYLKIGTINKITKYLRSIMERKVYLLGKEEIKLWTDAITNIKGKSI